MQTPVTDCGLNRLKRPLGHGVVAHVVQSCEQVCGGPSRRWKVLLDDLGKGQAAVLEAAEPLVRLQIDRDRLDRHALEYTDAIDHGSRGAHAGAGTLSAWSTAVLRMNSVVEEAPRVAH